MPKGFGRLKRDGQMGESVLERSRRLECHGKLVQAFAERYRKLIEFLIQSLQGPKLLQNLSKLFLKVVHRLEHFGQILDLRLEITKGLEHIRKLRKLVHRFQDKSYLSELILEWLDLLKNGRYRQSRLKRNLLI